jgi:hypothetical protein
MSMLMLFQQHELGELPPPTRHDYVELVTLLLAAIALWLHRNK